MKITVVGLGPGAQELMTGEARRAIESADTVLTSLRRGELQGLNVNAEYVKIPEMLRILKDSRDSRGSAAVVASGDTGFYSIAQTIASELAGADISFCPGISSFAYLAARLGTSYRDAALISLHGREGSIVPYASYNEKTFALTGGAVSAADVVNALCKAGLTDGVTVSVGENLSLPGEKITAATPGELAGKTFSQLSIVLVENPRPADTARTLQDGDFVRGGVPMTKREVMELICSALEVRAGDTVYDIGGGSGAVSCALAYRAREGMVYSVERNPEGAALIEKNRRALGAYNVVPVRGAAPEAIEGLPPATKVFVGGSGGRLSGILQACKREDGVKQTVAVTAVTLETLNEAMSSFRDCSMEPDVTCINAAHAERIGAYSLMKAENPVYIIKGTR